ncbi:MAG: purine-binding chemotaxis protein CheW [Spirochaetaceae bacterium]|nr:MAG: purine-binding chemotaxis protein CheW [Spirochaetaceae bacterium]
MEQTGFNQYLTFALAGETYAVDVRSAQTVLENRGATLMPQMPEHILGVIDFRGRAIPLVDLGALLNVTRGAKVESSMVVILEIPRPESGENLVVGATVDEVQEVITLRDEDLESAEDLGLGFDTSFVRGLARAGDGGAMFIILDPAIVKYNGTNMK